MQPVREDRVTTLATQLRKNLLSADDFEREFSSLSRSERNALVEYLDRIEKGPVELNYSSRYA